jgi:hypothetical protein
MLLVEAEVAERGTAKKAALALNSPLAHGSFVEAMREETERSKSAGSSSYFLYFL